MVFRETRLWVGDNTGVRVVRCIGGSLLPAGEGGLIRISVRKVRTGCKFKVGSCYSAIIIKCRRTLSRQEGFSFWVRSNRIALLKKGGGGSRDRLFLPIGTRIVGSVPSSFRYGRGVKLALISSGLYLKSR